MSDLTHAGRRFFDACRPTDRLLQATDAVGARPFRDRVALGYYDQPALTEAAVARMLQLLSAEQN